jgi:hypothetical protein
MNIEEQKKLLVMKSTTRSQRLKGDRSWEGRLWEICQTMNKNLMRGPLSGMRWHNTPKFRHSAQEVNEAFGQEGFRAYLRDLTDMRLWKHNSATASNGGCDQ